MSSIVEINCLGGTTLITTIDTIAKVPGNKLLDADLTSSTDPKILSIILDSLRRDDSRLYVPDDFDDWTTLAFESKRLGLLKLADSATPSTICISCQSALSTGRLNPEVTFRKVMRIVISGKVQSCRMVFGDTLNECRDGGGADFEEDRYTSRFFLKHNILERAFDTLAQRGYRLTQSNTFAPSHVTAHSTDEAQFIHHSSFIFQKHPLRAPHCIYHICFEISLPNMQDENNENSIWTERIWQTNKGPCENSTLYYTTTAFCTGQVFMTAMYFALIYGDNTAKWQQTAHSTSHQVFLCKIDNTPRKRS